MSVNVKNPAIRRIHADVRELMKEPSDQYHAAPLESNLFEWHFTLRGPPGTPFEGGVYHGRILLPPDYPFRPPDIMFTTPNGRFNVGTKICLTISSYHPEYWQPAWGIRLILEALISFFPTPSMGALGGLDWTEGERRRLALESREWNCYKCGHTRALLPELDSKGGDGTPGSRPSSRYADQIKELHKLKVKTAEELGSEVSARGNGDGDGGDGDGDGDGDSDGQKPSSHGGGAQADDASPAESDPADMPITSPPGAAKMEPLVAPSSDEAGRGVVVADSRVRGRESVGDVRNAEVEVKNTPSAGAATGVPASVTNGHPDPALRSNTDEKAARKRRQQREEDILTCVAAAIVLAMVYILLRKAVRSIGL